MQSRQYSNRRDFLREAAGAGISLGLAAQGALAAGEPTPAPHRPELAVIYFPHWHRYDHMDSWHGFGWTEWELVRAAPPRFEGHYQPLRPSWGFFDDSDPAWSQREIDLAADHGIDVFLFDWYWYSGVRIMQEALENGFLKAPNRQRMKFALMWANHTWGDYFPVAYDKPFHVWLPQRHSPADLARVVDYWIEHYFREPNYWRVDGRPVISIFDPGTLIQQLGGPANTQALLHEMDARLQRADLPPIHWNAMLRGVEQAPACREAGFHSATGYNITDSGKTSPGLTQEYEDLMETHRETWRRMSAAALPYCPVVTMGWDVTPRCEHDVPFPFANPHYPYGPVVVGNTPERFGRLCREAMEFAVGDARRPPAVVVNAWNEWTEGSYLLPEARYGAAYLEALREAWGRRKT
ncbi:MAG: glycoside hydrolase family 99-like domain-containing protein [Thermogutta sp.]